LVAITENAVKDSLIVAGRNRNGQEQGQQQTGSTILNQDLNERSNSERRRYM
jgi:hypothetical protein